MPVVTKGMNDKANTRKQCGVRAAMVNMLKKRIVRQSEGTGDAAPWSRHQKKALCFQTEPPHGSTPLFGQECWQSVGALKEATAERTAPPAGVEGDYLSLESIHSDAYIHFFAIVDSVKNHPASF